MEIDRLEWSAFRWDENVVRIQPTKHLVLKSEYSISDILMDPEVMSLLGASLRERVRIS